MLMITGVPLGTMNTSGPSANAVSPLELSTTFIRVSNVVGSVTAFSGYVYITGLLVASGAKLLGAEASGTSE